jgi:hypothetical protein
MRRSRTRGRNGGRKGVREREFSGTGRFAPCTPGAKRSGTALRARLLTVYNEGAKLDLALSTPVPPLIWGRHHFSSAVNHNYGWRSAVKCGDIIRLSTEVRKASVTTN